MIDKAYIQMLNGEHLNPNTFNAFYGLRQLGIDTESFEFSDINNLKITKETLVVGGGTDNEI